jgi:thiol-disulfide isomerase/thioredoxin
MNWPERFHISMGLQLSSLLACRILNAGGYTVIECGDVICRSDNPDVFFKLKRNLILQKRFALTVFLLVLSMMGVNSHASEAVAQQVFDWQPPEFVAKTAAGKPFHYPGDLQGPTIVLFWASWCPFCKALMPHLQSIIDEYNYEVRVLALSIREDENPVEFLEEYGYQFLLIPEAEEIAESWGVKGTPGLYLADQSGRAVFNLRAIPKGDYPPERFANNEELKMYQKAARGAPFWAAHLRKALDRLDGN